MIEKTLFYSNPYSRKFSLISRDFIKNFCESFQRNFSHPAAVDFISKTRIPNERELYGIFAKSLYDFKSDDDVHVATEVQIQRKSEDDTSSTGRVDLVVRYRKVTFLLEIKVYRVPLSKGASEVREISSKALKAWESACEQLTGLDTTSLGEFLDSERVIKMPVVLFLYFSGANRVFEEPLSYILNKTEQLEELLIESSFNDVYFRYAAAFDNTIETHRRKSSSLKGGEKVNLYGFAILSTILDQ